MRFVFIVILICFAQISHAQKSMDDFGFGFTLSLAGEGPVYGVTLPADVYEKVLSEDLHDIAVFNSKGEVLHHEVSSLSKEAREKKEEHRLPFFPFTIEKGETGYLSVEIETKKNGNITRVISTDVGAGAGKKAYLIDADSIKGKNSELYLSWSRVDGSFVIPVEIESSDDLVAYKNVKRYNLVDMTFMGNRLHQNSFRLKGNEERYLRLVFPEQGIDLVDVVAKTGAGDKKTLRHWVKADVEKVMENNTVYFELNKEGSYKIDSVEIGFKEVNSMLGFRVLSSGDDQNSWQSHGKCLLYSLKNNGAIIDSPACRLEYIKGKRVRFEILQNGASLQEDDSQIRLGYVPDNLHFLARGEPPFILAYGSVDHRVSYGEASLQKMIDENSGFSSSIAEIAESVVLGGEEALVDNKVSEKTLLLWLVLVGGVLLLGYMSWSLVVKMKD